jgi:NTE family protein
MTTFNSSIAGGAAIATASDPTPLMTLRSRLLGLALSGGGVRAAAFHAGVLRYLAGISVLESVRHVSSVSGGSLFMGLVLSCSEYKWPSSVYYCEHTYQYVRRVLTGTSLQTSALARLICLPWNWRFALSRANVIEQSIRSVWKIDFPFTDLDTGITWSINGTTAETGHRFRFKAGEMGEYGLGYAKADGLNLAAALAVSAAFPGGIGPLTIRKSDYKWAGKPGYVSVPDRFPSKRIHLYDGGVYDNLGIEPLYDLGTQAFREEDNVRIEHLIVSDAGAPAVECEIPHVLNPLRFKRIADVAFNQCRALRVRNFVYFLRVNPGAGTYLQIGSDAKKLIETYGGRHAHYKEICAAAWLDAEESARAAAYPTSLSRITEASFDLLARHGYETARWNDALFLNGWNAALAWTYKA